MAMKEIFNIKEVSFSYGKRPILKSITEVIYDGEVICLLGPNGSGKTTLLKIMLGLFPPETGAISFDGTNLQSIPQKRLARHLAYVPQVHRDAFTFAVEDVVIMGRLPYHNFFSTYTREDRIVAARVMERLGIEQLRYRPYTEISGGERQLTLIARAMSQGAKVFIMDEPVNGLDYGNQVRLLTTIQNLAKEGYTFVITTHFPDHALHTADKAILLKEGRIITSGSPQEAITTNTIYDLYAIDVTVVSLSKGRTVCLPEWRHEHAR